MNTKFPKYLILINIFLFSCKETAGQDVKNRSQKETAIDYKELIPKNQKIELVEEIDFDGDNKKETIITTASSKTDNSYEYWFKNGKIIYEFKYPLTSINKKWFVNIDDDPQNEVIRAQGFEDGIDYAIFDIQNKIQNPILYFNPALIDKQYPQKTFWGYPCDIQQIIINEKKEILISVDNNYEREGDYIQPKNQKQLPFIYFHGKTTQPNMTINDIRKPKYLKLNEILSTLAIQKPSLESKEIIFQIITDFNKDKIFDKIEVLKNTESKDEYDQQHFNLPIRIYKGKSLWKSNDQLIPESQNYCVSEGFDKIVVKNNYFTIEHQTCYDYNVLVSAYITFKVMGNDIYLHQYGENYFDKSNHEKQIPSKVWSEKKFGKIKFENLTNDFLLSLRQK